MVTTDLRPVHDTLGVFVEGVAPVQQTEVVPNQCIGHPPLVGDGETGLGGVVPQRAQKVFAFRHLKADDVAVRAAA